MKAKINDLIMQLENTLNEYLTSALSRDTDAYHQYDDILFDIQVLNARIQDLPELKQKTVAYDLNQACKGFKMI